MLYQAIRRGCDLYHSESGLSKSNRTYRKLLRFDMDQSKWRDPPSLDRDEVGKVRDFVVRTWKTRNMQAKSEHPNPPPNLVGVAFVVLQDVFVVDSASRMLRLGRKEGFGRRF